MKLVKLLLVFVLFFVTVNAAGLCKNKRKCGTKVSFSVVRIWQSYSKNKQCCACRCEDDDEWKEGVQEYYDGCKRAISKYRGKAHELVGTVMKSFEIYLTKLIYFSNSNSTILSTSSTAILEAMSRLKKLDNTSMQIVIETGKVFPDVVNDLNNVASKLSGHIGSLSGCFKDAVDDLGCEYSRYVSEFVSSCESSGCQKEVDFVPSLKKCQKLMNTVSLIAETLLNKCEVAIEVQESVLVLTLIFWWLTIAVQGMNSAVQDVLFENKCTITVTIAASSISFDYVLVSMTEAVSAVVLPFTKTIKEFLAVFVKITVALNTAVKDILGLFEGTAITVGDITRNLFKNIDITSTTKGVTNIVKGLLLK